MGFSGTGQVTSGSGGIWNGWQSSGSKSARVSQQADDILDAFKKSPKKDSNIGQTTLTVGGVLTAIASGYAINEFTSTANKLSQLSQLSRELNGENSFTSTRNTPKFKGGQQSITYRVFFYFTGTTTSGNTFYIPNSGGGAPAIADCWTYITDGKIKDIDVEQSGDIGKLYQVTENQQGATFRSYPYDHVLRFIQKATVVVTWLQPFSGTTEQDLNFGNTSEKGTQSENETIVSKTPVSEETREGITNIVTNIIENYIEGNSFGTQGNNSTSSSGSNNESNKGSKENAEGQGQGTKVASQGSSPSSSGTGSPVKSGSPSGTGEGTKSGTENKEGKKYVIEDTRSSSGKQKNQIAKAPEGIKTLESGTGGYFKTQGTTSTGEKVTSISEKATGKSTVEIESPAGEKTVKSDIDLSKKTDTTKETKISLEKDVDKIKTKTETQSPAPQSNVTPQSCDYAQNPCAKAIQDKVNSIDNKLDNPTNNSDCKFNETIVSDTYSYETIFSDDSKVNRSCQGTNFTGVERQLIEMRKFLEDINRQLIALGISNNSDQNKGTKKVGDIPRLKLFMKEKNGSAISSILIPHPKKGIDAHTINSIGTFRKGGHGCYYDLKDGSYLICYAQTYEDGEKLISKILDLIVDKEYSYPKPYNIKRVSSIKKYKEAIVNPSSAHLHENGIVNPPTYIFNLKG